MYNDAKVKILTIVLLNILLLVSVAGPTSFSKEDQTTQERLEQLKDTLEELEERIPSIGYINRQEAFLIFFQAAEEEQETVKKIESEMGKLKQELNKGKITESKYKRQRDLLRSKHLRAKVNVDLAILDAMIQGKGFKEIRERLEKLKERAKPMRETIDNLIADIEDYAAGPKKVSQTLDRLGNEQYKELNKILNSLAHVKITQSARSVALEHDYDLVIEKQEVVLYRKEKQINNLTGKVKEKLKDALNLE